METEEIECPVCAQNVRVPDSLLGKAVRCPLCKAYFTAPIRDDEGRLGEGIPLPPPRSGDSPLFVPALFLLLVSIIGLLTNGFKALQWATDRDGAEQGRHKAIEDLAKRLKMEASEDEIRVWIEQLRVAEIVIAGLSILPVLGAVSMLRRRFRWLAILGSVIAMLNVGNCCCLLGFPAGTYCLIKLLDPDVVALFRPTGPTPQGGV